MLAVNLQDKNGKMSLNTSSVGESLEETGYSHLLLKSLN